MDMIYIYIYTYIYGTILKDSMISSILITILLFIGNISIVVYIGDVCVLHVARIYHNILICINIICI